MSSLSLLPYVGSKRSDIVYFEKYFPKNIKTIVEPFGGSGYVSLYLFSKNPNLKCIVNDIDSELINFFHQLQKNKTKVINEYNKLVSSNLSKTQFDKLVDEYKSKKGSSLRKSVLYLFYNKCHGLRKGLYPIDKSFLPIDYSKYDIFFKWINNTEFTILDYNVIIAKYINKNVFIFLDPPYFDSFNKYYLSYDVGFKNKIIQDNTKMFIDIFDFLEKSKSRIMLIINKNAITEFIYEKYIIAEYDKIYQLTKKETKHLIITNY